ncbi:TIGR03084 family protein [Epidermidibacterium keratini]|uniref:TIGR03084 family protein n=1 Tax=Epidermidibacterium keratini TaxID=1891644 RepID=A0A7L4YNE3_9ACTN|nr:TIGR03084 family metal-binding protein [Epidermidibacterium keratini]QHC00329.1 TIGR03084 family protein [Epidermidibacterium keratini]
MADIAALVSDLKAEQESVDELLSGRSDEDWGADTPAEGWTVAHQVAHLAFFDGAVTESIVDPDAFAESLKVAKADPDYTTTVAGPLVQMRPDDLFALWRSGRQPMYDAMTGAPAGLRTQWYGPPMSVASACTARIMEHWAHGQDIADTFGVRREPTDRLRHVLHIGYRARGFAYANRDLPVPDADVRIEVIAPSGGTWVFGESETDVIRGSALDMALLMTQRRHRADTALEADGPLAEEFLEVAQAFAGKPGSGRRPGQFPPAA